MEIDHAIANFIGACNPTTSEFYRADLNQWLYWCISDRVDPLKAHPGEIVAYLAYLRNDVGLAPNTVIRKFYCLRSFFNWLVDNGEIPATPFNDINLPWAALKGQATEHKRNKRAKWGMAAQKTNDVQLKAILLLMAVPQIHMSDLCNIMISDLYPDTDQVSVWRRGQEFAITVPRETIEAIYEWLKIRSTHPKVQNVFLSERDGTKISLATLKIKLKRAEALIPAIASM